MKPEVCSAVLGSWWLGAWPSAKLQLTAGFQSDSGVDRPIYMWLSRHHFLHASLVKGFLMEEAGPFCPCPYLSWLVRARSL